MNRAVLGRGRSRATLDQLARVAMLCLCVGTASLVPAWANPKLLMEAQQLIASGNPKAAYMLLVAQQDKLAGDESFDYLLAVAALDSGKIDESIIAFERVLAVNPNNAGAELDLGRAYFTAGSLDLAEGTFKKLLGKNPPPAARMAIERYLGAIEQKRQAARRIFGLWGETSLGYDSNMTGVPNDFTTAVAQAFNIQGVAPTGNSLKRSQPYVAGALGAELTQPLSERWVAIIGGEGKARAYRRENDFNSRSGEARLALQYDREIHQFRVSTSASRFNQEGNTPASPGTPAINNNRQTAVLGSEYRATLPTGSQYAFGLSGVRTRFLTNPTEDFDSAVGQLAWTKQFAGASKPVIQLATFYSRDRAKRLLADGITDKSKKVAGVRLYWQNNLTDKLSPFVSVGGLLRRDDNPFTRATTVEFGRDRLYDAAIGANWRFQAKCTMRAQVTGAKNDSNISLYDYARWEASSNIRCDL